MEGEEAAGGGEAPPVDMAEMIFGEPPEGEGAGQPGEGAGQPGEGAGQPGEGAGQPGEGGDPDLAALKALTEEARIEKPGTPGTVNGYKLELPEGFDENHPLLEQFTKLAAETKADPKLVQGSVKLMESFQRAFFKEVQAREQKALDELSNAFLRQSRADPVYGGANFDNTTTMAYKAIRHFTSDRDFNASLEKDGYMGLKEFLVASRGLNHPVMRKLLAEVGKHISESPPLIPGASGANPAQKDPAELLFGGD